MTAIPRSFRRAAAHSALCRNGGFTLIELMIAIAIVAILASIALPSYRSYVMRGQTAQAFSQLTAFSVTLQQYYQDNRDWTGACAAGTTAPIPSANTGNWTYRCPTLSSTSFVIQAVGNTGSPVAGITFTLDNSGNRSTVIASGTNWPASTSCWTASNTGACY